MEKSEQIKKIEKYLTPKIIEKESIASFWRDLLDYEDHYWIDDAFFSVSILQRETYLIFDVLEEEEKNLNRIISQLDKLSNNDKNTLSVSGCNSKQKLKNLLYFKEKLIEKLEKEDRCDMIYLLYAY